MEKITQGKRSDRLCTLALNEFIAYIEFGLKLTESIKNWEFSMKYKDVVKEFNERPACTDSFVFIKDSMELLIKENAKNSSVYFLLYTISRSHYVYYQDQEMNEDFSNAAKIQMAEYLSQIQTAFETDSSENLIGTTDKVSREYFTAHKTLHA
jgi:hypothetical protein